MNNVIKMITKEAKIYEANLEVIVETLEEMITKDALLRGRVFRPMYGEFILHGIDDFVDGYLAGYVTSIISNLKSKPFKDTLKGSDFIELADMASSDILECLNFNLSIPFKEHVITLSGVRLQGTWVLVSIFENEENLVTRGLVTGGLRKGIRQVELFYKFGE